MNLLRLIFIALIVWLFFRVVRGYLNRNAGKMSPRNPSARIGTMVRCARCGLHVPESEALKCGEQYYCSARHRDDK
jgi:uncharacterized protein